MKILVLGDSYCPSSELRPAFRQLDGHEVDFADVTDEPGWRPASPSESKLKEYLGSPAQVRAAVNRHEVLVVQAAPISDEVIEAAERLRLICVARGGPVNVDIEAATARGIPVVTTPGKNANAVAELTIALMIMLGRRIRESSGHILAGGEVYRDNYEGGAWYGHELTGHTLGVIGFGQIGRRVATLARAFSMRVLAFDPFVPSEAIGDGGADPVRDLDELLPGSDYVSLHARATKDNRGLIGAAELHSMKRGAFLINTARDMLIVEEALDVALRTGHLGGAALDVASPSVAGAEHPLLRYPNVVLLPHIGGATIETLDRGGRMAVAEIERFLAGTPLASVVNGVDPASASGPRE